MMELLSGSTIVLAYKSRLGKNDTEPTQGVGGTVG